MVSPNFIPPECMHPLCLVAIEVSNILRSMGILAGNSRDLTARSLGVELIRASIPHVCYHPNKKKWNDSNLFSCQGCSGLFKLKTDTHPIDIFALICEITQTQEIKRFKNIIEKLQIVRDFIETKEKMLQNKILDMEYAENKEIVTS